MMNAFFRPAVVLMNKLKYTRKMVLLGSIAIVTVVILTFQLVTQSVNILDFSRRELFGIEYSNALISLMGDMQRYRQIENEYYLGDKTLKDRLSVEQEKIDKKIALVDEKDYKLGNLLKTSEDWKTIKNKWQLMKNESSSEKGRLAFYNRTDIISGIKNLIVTACDTSNLTLDPDIDTYYSMDTYCTKLPNFIEQIGLIRDIGKKAYMEKALSSEDREQLVMFKTLMDKFNKIGIKENIDKVIQENPVVGPKFTSLMQSIYADTNHVSHLLDLTLLSNNFADPASIFFEKYNALFDASYRLYTVTSETLEQLVQARVGRILNTLYINIGISVVASLLLFYLFFGFYLSIINSINRLVKGSEKMGMGDLTSVVELETHDELLRVAASFNLMRDSLSRIIHELHVVVMGAKEGDLSKRINLSGKRGFSHDLSLGVNQVSDTFQTVINDAIRVLDGLSKADLTSRITQDYKGSFGELKVYVNLTVESLEKLIRSIKIATETIRHAAKEIAKGNNDLAKRTEQQAAFLEETATSIEQVTVTVKQNAENAKQANQLAQSASDVAVKGGAVVGEVIETMSAINESARKVADIISVIDDIAFQTNILALNAAVEAARAGEQGRGFAVVATEVRNLAQRTSSAAKEIKTLISTSVENVAGGTKYVDQAGQTMEEIVKAVKQVSDIMSEIANASMEQSNGIEQVNQAVAQMDQVTQQNTALVEEAAAAAESMEEQTDQVNNLVNTFKLKQTSSRIVDLVDEKQVVHEETPSPIIHQQQHNKKTNQLSELQKMKRDHWDEF